MPPVITITWTIHRRRVFIACVYFSTGVWLHNATDDVHSLSSLPSSYNVHSLSIADWFCSPGETPISHRILLHIKAHDIRRCAVVRIHWNDMPQLRVYLVLVLLRVKGAQVHPVRACQCVCVCVYLRRARVIYFPFR